MRECCRGLDIARWSTPVSLLHVKGCTTLPVGLEKLAYRQTADPEAPCPGLHMQECEPKPGCISLALQVEHCCLCNRHLYEAHSRAVA